MGSTRLPGKMLADLAGKPLLEWVLRRVQRSVRIGVTVLATTDRAEDDALAELGVRLGVPVYRGSADDVLARFAGAASAHRIETVVRVCADNPLIDPEACDLAVAAFAEERPDYAFNHIHRAENDYPDGIGAEVLSADLLAHMDREAHAPDEREHVTRYIWNHAEAHRILPVPCPEAWRDRGRGVRLDVDSEADLARMRQMCEALDDRADPEAILARWDRLGLTPLSQGAEAASG